MDTTQAASVASEIAHALSILTAAPDKPTDFWEWDRTFTSGDDDLLLALGFEYGFSHDTMWGTDLDGNVWCVWFKEGVGYGNAEWYYQNSKGVNQRFGAMRVSIVHRLFDPTTPDNARLALVPDAGCTEGIR
jgi:hypothetical protein